MVLYRIERSKTVSTNEFGEVTARHLELITHEFEVTKSTEKGYWIRLPSFNSNPQLRWVSKSTKKRFAYPTVKEALEYFIKRNKRHIFYLMVAVGEAEKFNEIALQKLMRETK